MKPPNRDACIEQIGLCPCRIQGSLDFPFKSCNLLLVSIEAATRLAVPNFCRFQKGKWLWQSIRLTEFTLLPKLLPASKRCQALFTASPDVCSLLEAKYQFCKFPIAACPHQETRGNTYLLLPLQHLLRRFGMLTILAGNLACSG